MNQTNLKNWNWNGYKKKVFLYFTKTLLMGQARAFDVDYELSDLKNYFKEKKNAK